MCIFHAKRACKYLRGRERERVCISLYFTDWSLLTSPLETGNAYFIRTSKMDFFKASSDCL